MSLHLFFFSFTFSFLIYLCSAMQIKKDSPVNPCLKILVFFVVFCYILRLAKMKVLVQLILQVLYSFFLYILSTLLVFEM